MATTTTTQYVDDIDGTTEDVRTITFSVQGTHYEIDLSEHHRAQLIEALAVYVGHARKVSSPGTSKRGRGGRSTSGSSSGGPAAKDVRAWALDHGHTVPDRGRIPAAIFSAYTDAH